jgi:PAS domain S-box-containing protein
MAHHGGGQASAPRDDGSYEALLRSRQTLETLLGNLPGMAYRCLNDPDWSMEFVSDGCADLTGYAAAELVRGGWVAYGSLIHPDDRDEVWRQVQDALDGGRQFRVLYRLTTATGQEKWVWEQGRGVGTTADGLEVIEGFALDVTERKLLEERILASERTFRALYEQANDAIFVMRGEWFIDCNSQTEEMFGCSREQILQRSPIDFSPEWQPDGTRSRDQAMERIAAAIAGVRQRFDWRHTRLDGTEFDAEVSLSSIDLDGEPAILAIVRDVTERRQAYELLEQRVAERTEELRASEERYRTLFERSRDAIFIAAHTHIVDANEAALALIGAERDEVIGQSVDCFMVPGERDRINAATEAAGGAIKDFEIGLLRPDGVVLDCLLTAHTYEIGGETRGFEGILRDITEWKRTEEELFEQTRESAVLDERNRMAREIHDTLAQGLTGIVLQLEAAEQVASVRDEAAAPHIERAKALARESLQEARRSVWNLVPQALQDATLIDAIGSEVRRFAARGGGGQAAFAVGGAARPLPSDVEVSLLRICQEALMNVRKYAFARQVHVALDFADDAVRLAITDDGQGFDASGRNENDGLHGGFGLTTMEQRARQHGGNLTIDTAPGRGTRIEAAVPLSW